MLKNKSDKLILILALMLVYFANGQGVPIPGVPPPPPPPGLPIDGGLFVLAILGAFYGAKKLKK